MNEHVISARAVGDRILVQPIKVSDKIGSILVPEGYQKKNPPVEGIVYAVGRGRLISRDANGNDVRDRAEIEVGDHVFFDPFAGKFVPIDGCGYIVLTIHDIFAVVPRKADEEIPTPTPLKKAADDYGEGDPNKPSTDPTIPGAKKVIIAN